MLNNFLPSLHTSLTSYSESTICTSAPWSNSPRNQFNNSKHAILWSTPSTQLYVERQACKRTEFMEHESRPSTRAHKARKVHENTSTLISRLIDTVSLLIFELCVQFIHQICYSKIRNDVWKIIAENLAPFSIAWDSFNLFLGKLIFSLLGFFSQKNGNYCFPEKIYYH